MRFSIGRNHRDPYSDYSFLSCRNTVVDPTVCQLFYPTDEVTVMQHHVCVPYHRPLGLYQKVHVGYLTCATTLVGAAVHARESEIDKWFFTPELRQGRSQARLQKEEGCA